MDIYHLSFCTSQIIFLFLCVIFLKETAAVNTDVPQINQPSPSCAEIKQSNPGDRVDNTQEGSRHGVSQTVQPLLSDWRNAISKQPKVKQPGASGRASIREGITGQLNTKVGIDLFMIFIIKIIFSQDAVLASSQNGIKQDDVKQEITQDKSKYALKQDKHKAVFASQDVRQRKAVWNKLNREFRFMSEEVKFLKIFYLSFIKYFSDTWSTQI